MKIRDAISCLREETGFSRDRCIEILLRENKIRSGGNRTNGLLAWDREGASQVINRWLAHKNGIIVKDLMCKVQLCKNVKCPERKISDHLRNCQEYADPHRLEACDLKNILANLNLLSKDGGTVPVLCVNSVPVSQKLCRTIVSSWSEKDILTSPLLAAIDAYIVGVQIPQWIRKFI